MQSLAFQCLDYSVEFIIGGAVEEGFEIFGSWIKSGALILVLPESEKCVAARYFICGDE